MEIEILVWNLQDFEDFVIKVFFFRKRLKLGQRRALKQTNRQTTVYKRSPKGASFNSLGSSRSSFPITDSKGNSKVCLATASFILLV